MVKRMKKTVWRTDTRVFDVGEVIESAGDHLKTLSGSHVRTEMELRTAMGNRSVVRSKSLYTWEDEDWARRAWALERLKHLYKLEVDVADIQHRGDVNHYTDIGGAIDSGTNTADAIGKYLNGDESNQLKYSCARFEILVSKARVLEKYCPT